MTAAVYRSTTSLALPQTQNTALVLEFNCLYTHDIRRKQKRWQDGFLRYHTFNKRVMVYDVPRNFIGDAHWKADEALQDGDEVTLEKGGVIVQVAEAVGRTETDLTELRQSKKKGSSERGSSPIARGPQTPAPRPVNGTASRQPTQLKHRSLNALLGTPKGAIGKAALPDKSPFELRHNNVENEEWEQGRPPKRQRMDSPAARNVIRTTAAAKPAAREETPLWARTADAAKQRQKAQVQDEQQSLKIHEVIDLRDEEPEAERFLPGFSSDALAPPSSPPRESAKRPQVPAWSSSPAFQTQKPPPARTAAAECSKDVAKRPLTAADKPERVLPESVQGQATFIRQQDQLDIREDVSRSKRYAAERISPHPRPPVPVATEKPASKVKGSTLRIAASAPKKKLLLCQEQLVSKPKRISSNNTEAAAGRLLDAASDDDEDQPRAKTQRQLLEERLARIRSKQAKADVQRPKVGVADNSTLGSGGTGLGINQAINQHATLVPKARPQTSHETSALQLAEMDRMLLARKPHDANKEVVAQEASVQTDGHREKVTSPAPVPQTKPPRKNIGVGRKAIRASAQSCFPKPTDTAEGPQPVAPQPVAPQPVAPQPVAPQPVAPQHEAPQPEQPRPETPQLRPPPPKEDRAFRRVVSDSNNSTNARPRGTPGAPMRFTPSPPKQQPPALQPVHTKAIVNADRPPKPRPATKKPFQRAVSLNTGASGTAAVMLGWPFQPPKAPSVEETVEVDVPPPADPWSREAFDLFDWRPPGWDEERWCFKEMEEAVDGVAVKAR